MRLIALVVCAVAVTAFQDGPGAEIIVRPTDIKWQDGPPSLPKGAQFALLSGDPTKEGLFVMRLKLPADYKINPHSHGADEHVTILSGTLLVSRGDTFDATKAKELPEGSYARLPAKANHFAFTKGEVVLQLNSIGPWSISYVNPADDPRKK